MRTCIICLPRTGSQLCERMVASMDDALMLGEYFEAWNDSTYSLDEDGYLFRSKFTPKKESFNLHQSHFSRLRKIIESNKKQNFVLRMFLMDNYNKHILKFIIATLNNEGFNFLTLQRSLEDQLLSYCIAYTNFSNGQDTFGIDSTVNNKIFVDVSKIEPTIEHISRSNKNFKTNLSILFKEKSININHIQYESIEDDLCNIFSRQLQVTGNKTIKGDHLSYILNKEETSNLIKKYLN